jgi:hypothetical protein
MDLDQAGNKFIQELTSLLSHPEHEIYQIDEPTIKKKHWAEDSFSRIWN